jgi:hypothetical protein
MAVIHERPAVTPERLVRETREKKKASHRGHRGGLMSRAMALPVCFVPSTAGISSRGDPSATAVADTDTGTDTALELAWWTCHTGVF